MFTERYSINFLTTIPPNGQRIMVRVLCGISISDNSLVLFCENLIPQ